MQGVFYSMKRSIHFDEIQKISVNKGIWRQFVSSAREPINAIWNEMLLSRIRVIVEKHSLTQKVEILDRFLLADEEIAMICNCKNQAKRCETEIKKKKNKKGRLLPSFSVDPYGFEP